MSGGEPEKMSVVGELNQLAELHERGYLSGTEFDEAKQQLLRAPRAVGPTAPSQPAAPDGALLLYRLISSWLRRAAAAMAIVALLFGLVAAWSGFHYFDLHAQARAIQDATIARGFGLRIPDPRPTIDRAVLEARATGYGGLAAMTGLIALGSLIGALLVRPPRQPQPKQTAPDTDRDEHLSASQPVRGVHSG